MDVQAVVFDMDGVLIDSEVIWRRVREAFAAEVGRRWSSADQAAMMGCSTPDWSARMVERLGLKQCSPEQLAGEMTRRVRAAFEADLPVRPGASQALASLGRHWPLALASGSPRELVECAMARTGFKACFRSILCGDDVTRGKPHPDIYLQTLERLGVPAQAAVGIEDSGNGLRALRAAGMWAIAAPCPEFPLSLGMRALAHAEVADLAAVTPALVAGLAA
ncbi:MAG: HAD family phosphatase [Burkholderiales bacterium]|nr:HAD family phosphatase [Burkholderiales bacterium]